MFSRATGQSVGKGVQSVRQLASQPTESLGKTLHDFKEKTMTTRGPNMTQYLGLATAAAGGIIAYNYLKPKHLNHHEPNQNLLKPSSHSIDKVTPALSVDRAARE